MDSVSAYKHNLSKYTHTHTQVYYYPYRAKSAMEEYSYRKYV